MPFWTMKVNLFHATSKTALFKVLSFFLASALSIVNAHAESTEERLARLEQVAETRGKLQADMMFQLNQIQEDIQRLSGLIEEHQYQLKQLQERQRDLYSDIERRLTKLQQSSAGSAATGATIPSTSGSASNTQAQPSTNIALADDVHTAYQKIFAKVRERQYDEAISDYQLFLKTFPNSQYEANVHYWLGQIYYIKGELEQALNAYQQVVNRFPDSSRAADALFKTGKVLLQQNNVAEAKKVFNQVVEQFDGTSAQLAKAELDKLK
ncbi:MAG: tol-pal system protein YbgF [Gammaproteobacteria bacterium]|nr:tol-pal system protein YbgF [Gammaproteobacteria bacterium]